jgi:nicotinamide mononucleotide (NMN) deamidase PncC
MTRRDDAMDAAIHRLIEALHASPHRLVLALTGGGTGAAALLLSVPGGSRTVLEVAVPYHEQALTDFLGRRPSSFCSADTSRIMAQRALDRARWLVPGDSVAGVGCTASLRSDRPKRGDHRFHLTIATGGQIATCSLTLTKEARSREEEETVLDLALLNALAEAFGVPDRLDVPLLPGEEVVREKTAPSSPLSALLAGKTTVLRVEVDGRLRTDGERPRLLLSGSFNPLHAGHARLAEVASRLLGVPAAFELTVVNADKPALTEEEVRHRLAPFAWLAPVWLTRVPTFVEKAELFPGAVFVVGADTASRIVQPRFYQDSLERMTDALNRVRSLGCRFLVAGRLDREQGYVGLEQLEIPLAFRDLFTGIPEASFRLDLSSTELRASAET